MKHINFKNYLDYKILEKPLPCSCQDCKMKIEKWETERKRFEKFENDLLFKKQEYSLFKKIEKKVFPFKTVFAFGFSLFLLFGFLYIINVDKNNKTMDFEKEYSKIIAFYESPTLGDLEACSIIFENNSEKEDI